MGNPATDGMTLLQVHVKEEVRTFLGMQGAKEGLHRSELVRRSLYAWCERERKRMGDEAFEAALDEHRKKERARTRSRRKAA